jgi:hypothetical protein
MVKAFGMWEIIDSVGIVAKIAHGTKYQIEKHSLWDTTERDGYLLYDWPVHLSDNNWMTERRLLDLCDALLFAQQYFANAKSIVSRKASWEQTRLYSLDNLKNR